MFQNPLILAGLGGAVIPLLLHLLARARHRSVDWGAMMFLDGVEPKQSHSARLKQWMLLLTRMAVVAAIAVALARPILPARRGNVAADAPIRAVIVMDRSYSMAFQEAGRSRFEKARESALQVLSGMRRGDEVGLVFADERADVHEPTSNHQAIAREIAETQLGSGSADIASALREAKKLLERDGRFGRELYLICDRQALSWRNLNSSSVDAAWFNESNLRFYVIAVGGDEAENMAVESVDLAEPVCVRRQPTDVQVAVRNYGSQARMGVELTMSSNPPARKDPVSVPISIPPHSVASVRVPMTFDQAGSHVITASIKSPELEVDNRLERSIDVLEPIRVLIVSGDESGSELRRESAFLRLALVPHQARARGPDAAVVTVKTAEEWDSANLNLFQVVILANVPEITPLQARALEQRVYEGAGLIIAPGSLTRWDEYNSTLYRDGQGILPARVLAPTEADGSEATTIGKLEASHFLFRFRNAGEAMPDAVIGRYFPAAPRADASVLGRYDSGRPFLIEGRRGRGRVLLVTTALDADWSTLPMEGASSSADRSGEMAGQVRAFFLPFVQSMVRYVCAPLVPNRNLASGEPLVAAFMEPIESAELFRDGQSLGAAPISGRDLQVRYAETKTPGTYRLQVRLRGGQAQSIYYTVQAPRGESDLSAISDAQWTAYQRLLGFTRLDGFRRPIGNIVASDRGGRELWLVALIGAMGIGLCEMWLAKRWSREVT